MAGPKATFKLQRKIETSDGLGGFNSVWYNVANLRGTLTIVERSEKFISDASRVKSTHFFMTKYKNGLNITEKDRLNFGTDIYEIVFVDNIAMQNRFYEISLRKIE